MSLPPMISAKALGAMPQFTFDNVGEKALVRAFRTAGLPFEFIETRDGYISKHALATFIDEVSRALGDKSIGLLWAPALTVADYGVWGEYVLGAPTLGKALERAQSVMPYHSSQDRTFFRRCRNLVGYEYRFALKGHGAYPSIAYSALGTVLSIFFHYLGPAWRPHQIHLDLLQPKDHEAVEATFGCPVLWEQDRLEIVFERSALAAMQARKSSTVTLEDLKRERWKSAPSSFAEVVSNVLQLQVSTDGINLDTAARALDIGARTLQRRLQTDGTSFRALANHVKTERAAELLREGSLSVQEIAIDLGYENSQNFSRAFRTNTGLSPSQYAGSTKSQECLSD